MPKNNITEFPGAPLLPGLDETTLGSELLETETVQRARYSGRIVEKNEERVKAILSARAMCFPIRQICSAFQVSPHTLAEIERRHAVKLATLKDRLARKFGVFVELGMDRAIAEVGKMDRDKLLVSLGIAVDKMQILTGEPSVIMGSSDDRRIYSVEGLRARLQQARPLRDVTPIGSDKTDAEQTRASGALETSATPVT